MGRGFVALTGPSRREMVRRCSRGGITTRLHRRRLPRRAAAEISSTIEGRFEELYGTGAAGAVLVRPDGFVAWRARAADDDAEALLARAFSQILAR